MSTKLKHRFTIKMFYNTPDKEGDVDYTKFDGFQYLEDGEVVSTDKWGKYEDMIIKWADDIKKRRSVGVE